MQLMVSKQDGMFTKNSYSWHTLHEHRTSFFSRGLWFAGRKSVQTHLHVSDWLRNLIHIHSNRRVSHISNCSLTSEDMSLGWRPILIVLEEDAWYSKDTTLGIKSSILEPTVSAAFAKHPFNFVEKATRVLNCYSSERTCGIAERFERRFILKQDSATWYLHVTLQVWSSLVSFPQINIQISCF